MTDDPDFASRMSDADSLMWSIEKDPMLRSTITSVLILDRPLDRAAFRTTMDRASRVIPRLRQRVRSAPLSVAPPRWEFDPNFDLDYHLRWVRAPGAGKRRHLLEMAAPLAMQGFDRARPLWEVTAVSGLAKKQSAVILKVHHAVTDGIGGVRMMLEIFDFEREGNDRGPMPDEPTVHVLSQPERIVDAASHETRRLTEGLRDTVGTAISGVVDPAGSIRRAGDNAASLARFFNTSGSPLSPVMTGRSLSQSFDSLDFSLDDLKSAARTVGGHLNDAFVGGLTGGFRRYHERHGSPVDALRMSMPINVRQDGDDKAGNHFVPARFEVPVAVADPGERMTKIRERVDDARHEPFLSLSDQVSGLVNRLPTSLTTSLFGNMLRAVDFTASNVPGSPVPVYIAGGELIEHVAFGPIVGGASNITLLSLRDRVHIGFNMDPAAISDPAHMIADMAAGFAEVIDIAS